MSVNFCHLHCHSSIGSMLDSMARVDELFKKASELGQNSIAITDHGTLAAIFDARKASKKYGVKYIPGMEAYFVEDVKDEKYKRKHLVLLAKNEIGYKNLLRLNYLGYKNSQYVPFLRKVFPRIDFEMLEKNHEGIICTTACGSGPLSRALLERDENKEWHQEDCYIAALGLASRLREIFGKDLYLEMQPHDLKVHKTIRKTEEIETGPDGDKIVVIDQSYLNNSLIKISKELDIPLVAACDVHYIEKEDAKIHDMLMAINEKKPLSDKTRHRYEIEEFYMKDGDTVKNYFTRTIGKDLAEEACNNTIRIADMCEDSAYIDNKEIRFPKFDITQESDYKDFLCWKDKQTQLPKQDDHAFLRYKSIKIFKKRFSKLSSDKWAKYKDRMISEIKVFESRNFSSYMLITADLLQKAREQGIRTGPGRGSVGGSLIASLLDIHEVDPLQYGLLFERFINVHKADFPDIDSDFDPNGKDWVEKYVIDKYGEKCVAHVSNLSTITPKVVIKDIARSLELGGNTSEAFKIANQITNTISKDAKSFDDAIKDSKDFKKYCEQYPDLEKYGRKLVGLEKTFSTHAAGVIISDIDLTTFVPLRFDKDGTVSVQYEKERCEENGLIKMDFLGLEHLKIIDSTIENVEKLGGTCSDTPDLTPFNDSGVWNMISKGHTLCVFQVGSSHMGNLCKKIKPQNIEDLALVNALGRPSSIKSREAYIMCRNTGKKVIHKHKCVQEALDKTLGVCVYEDQLMKFANLVAGWDLNKADGLRKLTKLKGKNPKMAEKLKADFIDGAAEHNSLSRRDALEIWEDIINPFSGYGFNKPHGIFYSLNGYHTAYYKYHYPAAFMAAVLKSEVEKPSSNEEKIKAYKREAKRMGIKVIAPDINNSAHYFSVLNDKTIVMGLAAVRGVGVKAVNNIIETREQHKFESFADFLYRTSSRMVRKDVIQALAKAGCFDSLNITRSAAFTYYAKIRAKTNKYMESKATTGGDSWDLAVSEEFTEKIEKIISDDVLWSKQEILYSEGETLGEYISGNINDLYDGFFTKRGISLAKINMMAEGTPICVEGIVDQITQTKTKSGKNKGSIYGRCSIVDKNKNAGTMMIWSDLWKIVKNKIKIGRPFRAICRINEYNGNHMLILNKLENVA